MRSQNKLCKPRQLNRMLTLNFRFAVISKLYCTSLNELTNLTLTKSIFLISICFLLFFLISFIKAKRGSVFLILVEIVFLNLFNVFCVKFCFGIKVLNRSYEVLTVFLRLIHFVVTSCIYEVINCF